MPQVGSQMRRAATALASLQSASCYLFRYLGHHSGQIPHGQARIGVVGEGGQGCAPGLENRTVVHGKDATPSLLIGAYDGAALFGADHSGSGRPFSIIVIGVLDGEMTMQAVMKQHSSSHHKQAPLGGDTIAAVGVAFFSGAGLVGGQVQGPSQTAVVIGGKLPHCLVQSIGKLLSRDVRATEGVGGLLYRLGKHGNVAHCPVAGRFSRLEPKDLGQRCVAQVLLGNTGGVAEGKDGGGQPLAQTRIGVLDGLGLPVKALSASSTMRRPSTLATMSIRLRPARCSKSVSNPCRRSSRARARF